MFSVFLQGYILANTSLKLIFSEKATKFEKIFHIFLHLQNMEDFFLYFVAFSENINFTEWTLPACSISFSATTKSFRENWCIALLTSIIWQIFQIFFYRATLILANTSLPSRLCLILAQFPFPVLRKNMGNKIFSWNWCISLLTSILWQYFLFTEWPLPNTCSTSFSVLTKILLTGFTKKLGNRCSALLTSTIWRFFLICFFLVFSGLHSSSRIHCNRVAFAQYLLRHLVPGLWSWLFSPCCPLQPYLDRKQRT